MKKLILLAIIGLGLIFGSMANAGKLYGGLNYSKIDYDETGFSSLDLSTKGIIIGYDLTDNFSIEARHSTGEKEDDVFDVDISIDKATSLYGKLALHNASNLTPYFLLGWTKGEIEAEGFGSETDEDISYGVGVMFALSDNLHADLEYIRLFDESDYEIDSAGISVVYHF